MTAATDETARQGSLCCGCLFDYRRAVIIIGIIFVIVHLAYIIILASGAMRPGATFGNPSDQDKDAWESGPSCTKSG